MPLECLLELPLIFRVYGVAPDLLAVGAQVVVRHSLGYLVGFRVRGGAGQPTLVLMITCLLCFDGFCE